MKVFLNGKFLEEKNATISIKDHGFLYGDGIFETLLYEHNIIENFNLHLQRLKKSAKIIALKLPKFNIENIIQKLVKINNLQKARIRITVTRGENNFQFNSSPHPTILITTVPLLEHNLRLSRKTCTLKIENPHHRVKSIQLFATIQAKQKMTKLNCSECFFLNQNNEITEGSGSNFFAVKNKAIYTPPSSQCLKGTMRETVLQIAQKNNIKTHQTKIPYQSLSEFDECFWTNSIHHIIPIQSIDNKKFTCIGEITKKIIKLNNYSYS